MFAVISIAVCFAQLAAAIYVLNSSTAHIASKQAHTQLAIAQARKQHAAQAAYIRKHYT